MPFSIKGQNVTIDFPDKPHKLFNESLYDTASQKMRENARKLTLDQMDAFTKFGQALDANMAERIRNVTGLTATNSSTLEIELKTMIFEIILPIYICNFCYLMKLIVPKGMHLGIKF